MIVDSLSIEPLGWGNARIAWTGDPDAVSHVFVNGSASIAPQRLPMVDKSVVVGLSDPFTVEVHEAAEGVEVAAAGIALRRTPVIWWSAREGAAEYRVHYRPDGQADRLIGATLPVADALHYQFQCNEDLREDGRRWGFLRVEAVSASGKTSARPSWPLFVAALPQTPTGLSVNGGAGVFALTLEVAS